MIGEYDPSVKSCGREELTGPSMRAEIEALYFLKKYRAMKGRYYGDEPQR